MFGSVGNIFGSAIDGGVSIYNARQAQKHQEKMYKHRYQWATKDARKAGLNPILTTGHGPGTAPSAPQAQQGTRFGEALGKGAQTRLAREQVKSAETDQMRNIASARQHEAQTRYYQEQARTAAVEADQKLLSHQHWLDNRSGSSLSSAKAMSDAGYSPSYRSIGGAVSGLGNTVRNWFSRDKRDSTQQTSAKEARPMSKKDREKVRKKAFDVNPDWKKRTKDRKSIGHMMRYNRDE